MASNRRVLRLPREVEVIRHIRGDAPTMVIHALAQAGEPLRFGDVVERVDLASPTVGRVLAELEDAGVVKGDLPRGKRSGRGVLYSLDRDRVHAIVDTWRAYLDGNDVADRDA